MKSLELSLQITIERERERAQVFPSFFNKIYKISDRKRILKKLKDFHCQTSNRINLEKEK